MKIELIPVIELGFEEEHMPTHPSPDSPYWQNTKDWEKYFAAKVKKNGYENHQRIMEGYPFYRVNQFTSKKDILKLVYLHIGGEDVENKMPLNESCALFGGYVLLVNDKIIFTPQCCSTLADFSSWISIIQDEFETGYICYEGHPCPKVERTSNNLEITFDEVSESFIPPAINTVMDRDEMIKAIEKCQMELDGFGHLLNSLEEELNQKNIADILIYEKE